MGIEELTRDYHLPSGVSMKYQGLLLACSAHKTAEENLEACKRALCILYGYEDPRVLFGSRGDALCQFESEGGTINLFRSRG